MQSSNAVIVGQNYQRINVNHNERRSKNEPKVCTDADIRIRDCFRI